MHHQIKALLITRPIPGQGMKHVQLCAPIGMMGMLRARRIDAHQLAMDWEI